MKLKLFDWILENQLNCNITPAPFIAPANQRRAEVIEVLLQIFSLNLKICWWLMYYRIVVQSDMELDLQLFEYSLYMLDRSVLD